MKLGFTKRLRHWSVLALLNTTFFVVCVFSFQNCGKGFKAVTVQSTDASSVLDTKLGPPGAIIPLSPYASVNNTNIPFNYNLSAFLINKPIQHLKPGDKLTNGIAIIEASDAFPDQLANPNDSLMFDGGDPRLQQVNAYYHIDELVSALSVGGVLPTNYPAVHVNSHCNLGASSRNNAFFDTQEKKLCMGYSPQSDGFNVWSANDADVLVHEFGHSVNHTASTDDILGSNSDMGALDEGFADVWAFLANSNPYIANWYGKAIYTSLGASVANFKGLRNLTTVPSYPSYLVGEIHDDSTGLSTVFYALVQAGVPRAKLRQLAIRVLSDLQSMDSFGSAAKYMIQESAALGISTDVVRSALNLRGLFRKDDLAGLNVTGTGVNVIDNHAYSVMKNGNCNRAMDVGETNLVVVDLQNTGLALGTVVGRLSTLADPAAIKIEAGGDLGSYLRVNAASSFINSVKGKSQYRTQLLYSGFLITANAAGTYQFTLAVKGFDSIDEQPSTKTLSFSITVGTGANIVGTCGTAAEEAVWP
jgi:hypothetical protein